MEVYGIIAEWNPFHCGHATCVDTIRRVAPEAGIIAVMSGPFTQRGTPAVLDKWTRAGLACAAGVDVVFELPQCYATDSLEGFAFGGAATLLATGVLTGIAFGSESGDANALRARAQILRNPPPHFNERLQKALQNGTPYAQAKQTALKACVTDGTDTRHQPNDRLAVQYLANLPENTSIIAIPRTSDHHGTAINQLSGSAIRAQLYRGVVSHDRLPPQTQQTIKAALKTGWQLPQEDTLWLTQRALICSHGERLAEALHITDGWAAHLYEAARTSHTYDAFLQQAQTRHYSQARIARLLLELLSPHPNASSLPPPYLRLLSFSTRGRSVLRWLKQRASVPVINHVGRDQHLLSTIGKQMLTHDLKRQDLSALYQTAAPYNRWQRDYLEPPRNVQS